MNRDFLHKYAPLLIICIAVIFQYNLFVTPEKLEHTHREILAEVAQVYIIIHKIIHRIQCSTGIKARCCSGIICCGCCIRIFCCGIPVRSSCRL